MIDRIDAKSAKLPTKLPTKLTRFKNNLQVAKIMQTGNLIIIIVKIDKFDSQNSTNSIIKIRHIQLSKFDKFDCQKLGKQKPTTTFVHSYFNFSIFSLN